MSFYDDIANRMDDRLASADERLAELYPGDRGVRQPVHTVYVPADKFTPDLAQDWGRQARTALDADGGTADELAAAIGA
ncbi:MAG TPA: aldolase, partial [Micropruina sp.]|nr:aldolase [Micropruina sp.]